MSLPIPRFFCGLSLALADASNGAPTCADGSKEDFIAAPSVWLAPDAGFLDLRARACLRSLRLVFPRSYADWVHFRSLSKIVLKKSGGSE